MKKPVKTVRKPDDSSQKKGFSQMVFVLIGLAIIAGGVWSLYMNDAPYHPEDQVTRGSFSLIAD
ncbi:hypothetical protein OS190_00700 [Sulfitobacter sp. F26204]|uniref:hypothetical protein n=1 Tax=Sulfitobacter sp. F26204 TaxID=2996014 RepID=UPI00225E608B|nr:hypothetical protein [Sulfitobacter sp. F26204]MCX7558066.1 hypothetical protein [Sulfitobacter sp. F26204]